MLLRYSKSFFKEIFFYKNLPSFLLISLPLLLISGSFLPDLAVTLSSIIFVINSIRNNLIKYYKNFFFCGFLCFYIILIFSSIFSNYPIQSLPTSLFYLRFAIFALSTWHLISLDSKIINYFFYSISTAFVILIVDGYFQFFNGNNLLGWPIYGTRVSSLFGEELILGSYISRLLPVLFACLIVVAKSQKKKYLIFFSIVIFVLSDVLVFLSGERAALFYINIGALILIFVLNSYKKFRFFSFTLSIFIILILSMYYPKFKERVFDQTLNQISLSKSFNFSSDTKRDAAHFFTIEHDFLYKSSIAIFLDNKFLGAGPRLFRVECKNPKYFKAIFSCSTHSHNTYIQLLAETGIFGFFLIFSAFVLLSFYFLKHFFIRIKHNNHIFSDFELSLMTAIFVTLWPLIPTGNFFSNWINIIYYLPVGFLLYSLDKKNKLKIQVSKLK